MAQKKVTDLYLSQLGLREAAKGFLISLRASSRYAQGYLHTLEHSIALLSEYAEGQGWPRVGEITTGHMEAYFSYLQDRPRWFGEQGKDLRPPSRSYIETQYRRIKRFFNWLLERSHVESNPLALIPHPKVEERVVPTLSERQILGLFTITDPGRATTPGEQFRAVRNSAALCLLLDTPGRRNEIGQLTVDHLDLDIGTVLVMGKGSRQRWMPLGKRSVAALWEYLQARSYRASETEEALWLDERGNPMKPTWLYLMLKRVGRRAGIPQLHTHMFRHTFAVTALRGGMPERVLMLAGGWKKIPDTYLRTLGDEDVRRFHQMVSPVDKLEQVKATQQREGKKGKSRGKL